MPKRIIHLCMFVIVLLLIIVSTTIAIADEGEYENTETIDLVQSGVDENISWSIDSDGVLTIAGDGPIKKYSYGTGGPWCIYASTIKTIRIQNGITGIGTEAFYGCSEVINVIIPESLGDIFLPWTFSYCRNLRSFEVSMESQYYSSYDGVLYNAEMSELISCPQGKDRIEIPYGVLSISSFAFYSCDKLIEIILPESVNQIGTYAFGYCTLLSYISIPYGVSIIDANAFWSCTNLNLIVLPSSVTTIRKGAFGAASKTLDIYYLGSEDQWRIITIDEDDNDVLNNASYYFNVTPSQHVIDMSHGCGPNLSWSYHDNTLFLTGFGEMSDYEAYYHEDYSIDFSKCPPWWTLMDAITSIEFEGNITSIGDGAFSSMRNLTSITIPNGVTRIGNYALIHCINLSSVNIPSSVNEIGTNAFQECESLTSIVIPSGVTVLSGQVFCSCQNLSSVTLPDSIISIMPSAFLGTSIKHLRIPKNVTRIGEMALAGMPITDIVISSKELTIEKRAFYYSDHISDIYYWGTPEEWDNLLIAQANNESFLNANLHFITESTIVNLPSELISIESEALINTPEISAVRIPANVTNIAVDAFDKGMALIVPTGSRWVQWAYDHGYMPIEE